MGKALWQSVPLLPTHTHTAADTTANSALSVQTQQENTQEAAGGQFAWHEPSNQSKKRRGTEETKKHKGQFFVFYRGSD